MELKLIVRSEKIKFGKHDDYKVMLMSSKVRQNNNTVCHVCLQTSGSLSETCDC